jgi:hypothetical protein
MIRLRIFSPVNRGSDSGPAGEVDENALWLDLFLNVHYG